MSSTQTPGVGVRGEDAADTGHIDTLDKPADYDPDVLGAYGLEPDSRTCSTCGDTPRQLDEAGNCTDCAGCTDCGREVSRPGCCFDCAVESSYVGGLAPRFGAQP